MLELKNISKDYIMQDEKVHALKDVSIKFRETEFVSILGHSGCGKTTLLNIIGGLDKYTSGDLIINGKSTKEYKDKDWDNYRNHRIGFIFQSYNLIPHLNVLENVELALTLSGIGREERRKRAQEVLEKVGLSDKLKSRPNQLSGGQMQRVAIARALVNNPSIILADEPTGALDSKTSVQIMELLKEISHEKLIIMVTHNPEIAEEYSNRIIRLKDGELAGDTNPYLIENEIVEDKAENVSEITEMVESKVKDKKKNKKEKTKMGFFTALSLSFKNLLTKKTRTLLVSFAGSIGIIGIALILSLSSGFQAYVDKVQKDTLSSYPIELTNNSYDMASLMQIFLTDANKKNEHDDDKVYTKQELTDMLSKFNASSSKNDLKSFKTYIEGDGKKEIEKYTSAIQYVYNINVNAYYDSVDNGLVSANLTTVFADVISNYPTEKLLTGDQQIRYALLNYMFGEQSSFYSNEFWSEMLDNQELLKDQYELVGEGSKWANEYNEIMVVVDKNNEISDYTLYGLGLLKQSELEVLLDNYINNQDSDPVTTTFEYEDLLNLKYKILLESDYFIDPEDDGVYVDIRDWKESDPDKYATELEKLYNEKGIEIKVAGLIREKENASALSIKNNIAYSSKLTKYIIEQNNNSDIVKKQLQNPTTNVLTNTLFDTTDPKTQQLADVLNKIGYADLTSPEGIYLYPINFDAKSEIADIISRYNDKNVKNGHEEKVITYSDTIGTMMASVTTIISAITYVLIAFVSISLIVSSIMIGIITYISVLERIKEIGVLRSIGASKKDIKRVFVSESVIIGFVAGVLGIGVTLILNIPINIIINSLAGLSGIASLPWLGGIVLVLISVFLTFIAGLIPARIASKKDPVIALRSE